MSSILALGIAAIAVAFFVWILIPSSTETTGSSASGADTATDSGAVLFIDPNNAEQIGRLVGMAGGNIVDAAIIRSTLQRFEAVHGRRATTQDIGMVLGMLQQLHPPGSPD